MLKVGITGGIGSGKSTVCQVFETLGIPVLYADDIAKQLMQRDDSLKAQLLEAFGPEVYKDNTLNRAYLAEQVFRNPERLELLNSIVHPAVIAYGADWMQKQKAPYVLKEAALFFESGSYKQMDIMLGVSAPYELRMSRSRKRGHLSREQVQARMDKQMDEAEKMSLCRFVIVNDERQSLIEQVLQLHKQLLALAATT